MIIARYEQQPHESRLREIVGDHWFQDGELFSSVALNIEKLIGPDPVVIPFTCSAFIVAGTVIRHNAAGGDDLSQYKVTFLMTTNLQIKEDEIIFTIKER